MTGTWPTGWATGDVEQAAEFKKGIGCISDQTLGGSAATVNVASIVATYAHLLVVVYARSDVAAISSNLCLNFNGDAAANYDRQVMQGSAATAAASEGFATNFPQMGSIPANTAGANLFGSTIIFIPHYAGASNNKVALAIASAKSGVATTNIVSTLGAVFWRSNAAINRVTLVQPSGNFVAGTRMSIYGMGA